MTLSTKHAPLKDRAALLATVSEAVWQGVVIGIPSARVGWSITSTTRAPRNGARTPDFLTW